MGFKLKNVLKKVEKSVKKVAPAILTVANPALGAAWSTVQNAVSKAKTQGAPEEAAVIATSGVTGYTGMNVNTAQAQALATPAPQPYAPALADRAARGTQNSRRNSVSSFTRGMNPLVLIGAAFGGVLLLVLLLRRK